MENPNTWGRLEYAIYKAWNGTQIYIPEETQAQLIIRVCRSRGALLLTQEEIPRAIEVIEAAIIQYQKNIKNNIIGNGFESIIADALREAGLAKKEPPRCLYSHFKTSKS